MAATHANSICFLSEWILFLVGMTSDGKGNHTQISFGDDNKRGKVKRNSERRPWLRNRVFITERVMGPITAKGDMPI